MQAIPLKAREQIDGRIVALASNPYPAGTKALQGKEFAGLHRIRSGDYRIVYQVVEARLVISVVRIGNRRDVYRGGD